MDNHFGMLYAKVKASGTHETRILSNVQAGIVADTAHVPDKNFCRQVSPQPCHR
jgi:hypothetical protein